jgi:excisionase family DNA binding protein
MMKRLLTPEEVANVLQLHHLTVLKLIKTKKLRAVKLGRVYRIREEDLEKFFVDQATA